MRRVFSLFAFLGIASAVSVTYAQNLLVNGDLEATPFDVYYDGSTPSSAGDVPGWTLFVGAQDGSYSYVNGVGSGNVDLDLQALSKSGIATAPLSRPAVVSGLSYVASLTTDNYFAASQTSYFIDWYNIGGTLVSSSGGGPLGDPNGPLTFLPYTQSFSVVGVAPATAVAAGVRLVSGDASYPGLTADNFSLSAVPEPTCATLMILAALALPQVSRRRE